MADQGAPRRALALEGGKNPGLMASECRVFRAFILFSMNPLYTSAPGQADPERGARLVFTQVADKVQLCIANL
jgi:hypothetical protein